MVFCLVFVLLWVIEAVESLGLVLLGNLFVLLVILDLCKTFSKFGKPLLLYNKKR